MYTYWPINGHLPSTAIGFEAWDQAVNAYNFKNSIYATHFSHTRTAVSTNRSIYVSCI